MSLYISCISMHNKSTCYHISISLSLSKSRFLSFDETIQLALRYALPLVGYELLQQLSAEALWAQLAAAAARPYGTVAAPLEGFVVREARGPRIAKARVEQLQNQPEEKEKRWSRTWGGGGGGRWRDTGI